MKREEMDNIIDFYRKENIAQLKLHLWRLHGNQIHALIKYMGKDLNYSIDDILDVTKHL